MHAMFSPDSRFMRIMSRVADLILLNLCYLLTCLPVFTIGAAGAALYAVCFRFGTEEEAGVMKSYFRAFREHFKRGTGLWLIVLLCGATALINAWVLFPNLKFGNNPFDLSRFSRRRKRRQPKNMAHITSEL